MTLLMMLLVSVLIGWFAQTKKGRTGAKWAIGTLALMIVSWIFMSICMNLAQPGFLDSDENTVVFAVLIAGGVGILMGLAVWSLPKKPGG